MKHIKKLLERGLIPISVDYRLCPEVNLTQGPMTDALDALAWVRSTLPSLPRARPKVLLDTTRVAAVGWSAGGHLAMTLAYTAQAKGIMPPDVVLAFYAPSDFEAECTYIAVYSPTGRNFLVLKLTNDNQQGGKVLFTQGRSKNRQTQSTIS